MANQVKYKIGRAEAVSPIMNARHKPQPYQGVDKLADRKLLWDKMLAGNKR